MGNKIEASKKKAKLSSAELRKKKKDRMARRKRGEVRCCRSRDYDTIANNPNRRSSLMRMTRRPRPRRVNTISFVTSDDTSERLE